jgi:tape measure domain-containing protein
MQFNNKQFEEGIQTSVKSLDTLKKSLDNTGRADSLSLLQSSIDNISGKFSMLGIIGVTALQNIVNSAVDAGKRIVEALSIAPITTGFAEYELKMNSVQTIMASTGETLETVTKHLNELNEYADQTIYSFSDMTRNIGKFTNAGVPLEQAVKAIQGISNEAAVSGANANEASRAMYNFAQALSAGYVKLIDWKSIELANMATVEFKQQLIDTAVEVGTLTKQAGGMYKVLTKNLKGESFDDPISATKMFNESLNNQWMTTDVLVKTLGKYADETTAIGKKAFAAAQDIKTISQLYDTLKEAAGSGWAQTWELVIGDFNEAKKLLTNVGNILSGFIQKSADARNEMLSFWKANGGRDTVIKALANAFNTLKKAVTPVVDAFRQIFPPLTGETLIKFSNGLLNLTEKFQISDETADKLRRTFAGLFAGIDILLSGFKFLAGGLIEIISALSPLGEAFLSITATVGDFIVALRNGTDISGIFDTSLDKIKDILDKISDALSNSITKIKEYFAQFSGVDLGPLEIFSKDVEAKAKPLFSLGDMVSTAFDGIKTVFDWVMPYFSTVADKLSTAFQTVYNWLGDAGKTLGFESLSDAVLKFLQGGALAGLLSIMSTIQKASLNVTGILSGLGDTLAAFQNRINSEILLNIALAIGVLAASLLLLSTIPEKELTTALTGISVLFIELGAAMAVLNKINIDSGTFKMGALSAQMIAMSTAILILSAALKNLSSLSWSELAKGVVGIAALSAVLVTTANLLGKSAGKMTVGAFGLIALSTGILILTQSVKQLSTLSWEDLATGLAGVGALLLELTLFMKLMGNGKGMITTGLALVPLATGLLILSFAVRSMATLSWEELGKGLVGVAGALGVITVASKLISPGNMLALGASLIGVGAGLNLVATAMLMMSTVSWEDFSRGFTVLGSTLAAIVMVSQFVSPPQLLALGAAMAGVSFGLNLIATSMLIMSTMSWESMAISFAALTGSLVLLAGAMSLMQKGVAGAAALSLMAIAIGLLVPSLVVLSLMDLTSIGKMLLALAGIFAVFAVAGLALAPLAPALLALSGSIALLGLGVLALGVGLTLASAAMVAFTASSAGFAVAVVAIISSVLSLIPVIVEQIGTALILLVEVIVKAAPLIGKAVSVILDTLLKILLEYTPQVINIVLTLLSDLLAQLGIFLPTILDNLMTLLITVLTNLTQWAPKLTATISNLLITIMTELTAYMPQIVYTVATLLLTLLSELAEYVDDFVVAALNLIIAILDGITQGIPDVMTAVKGMLEAILLEISNFIPWLVDEGFNMITNFLNEMSQTIDEKVPELIESAKQMIESIVDGIVLALEEGIPWLKEQMKKVANALWTAFKEFFGINSPSKLMQSGGDNIILGLIEGLGGGIAKVGEKALEIGKKVFESIKEGIGDVTEIAGDVISGLKNGIESGFENIGDTAKSLGGKLKDGFCDFLGINSPSKVMTESGMFAGEGVVIGLEKMARAVGKTSENIGNSAVEGMSKSLSELGSGLSGDMDLSPTIRPVIDMSNVESGLNNTFGKRQTLNVDGINAKVSDISRIRHDNDNPNREYGNTSTDNSKTETVINVYNTVRNDNDITKINRGLEDLAKKYSRARGVLPA